MNLKFDAIIFDMDGLMFDTESIAQSAWQQAAKMYGYEFTPEIYTGIIGLAYPGVERYTRSVFGEDFPLESIYPLKQEIMDKYITTQGIPVKPGLLDLLQRSEQAHLPRALASSSDRAIILRNLRAAGLDAGWFGAILGGDDIHNHKPAPDIYLLASQRLHVPAEKCLVLEDSNAGIQAACSAGMQAMMVPDMLAPTAETRRCACRILPDLHAVRRLLFPDPPG